MQEPSARLAAIRAAGKARVPFTSGLLIGIGETRAERIQALLHLRDVHAEYGHIEVTQLFFECSHMSTVRTGDPRQRVDKQVRPKYGMYSLHREECLKWQTLTYNLAQDVRCCVQSYKPLVPSQAVEEAPWKLVLHMAFL